MSVYIDAGRKERCLHENTDPAVVWELAGGLLPGQGREETVPALAARHPCQCLHTHACMYWCEFFRGFKKYSLCVVDKTHIN